MGTRPTVAQYHFEGWDLPTKYGWMHSGAGVQAATLVQDVTSRIAERMITSGELVSRLLWGAEWAGAAAGAAGVAMQRGADQITQTAAETATAQRCVTELGESFLAARNRVPSPNEIPTGLGDKFLYGAAEGFTALSPFDVQSPLHDAMAQRREPLAGASPMSTGLAGTTGSGIYRSRPGAVQPTGIGTGAGPGSAAFGPSSSGHTGAARGRAGLGVRPGGVQPGGVRPAAGRDGIPSRGAPMRDGPVGGPVTSRPRGAELSGRSRADAGAFLQLNELPVVLDVPTLGRTDTERRQLVANTLSVTVRAENLDAAAQVAGRDMQRLAEELTHRGERYADAQALAGFAHPHRMRRLGHCGRAQGLRPIQRVVRW